MPNELKRNPLMVTTIAPRKTNIIKPMITITLNSNQLCFSTVITLRNVSMVEPRNVKFDSITELTN